MSNTAGTILGGGFITASHLNGTRSDLVLRQLSIRQLYQFCRDFSEERGPELVALCLGKDMEWVDTLTPESYAELYTRAFNENFPKAAKILQSDPSLAAKVGPAIVRLQNTVTAIQTASSYATSPAPAPSASAEANGSVSST